LWRLMLFTVFLVYPYVSSSIFRMYVCYYLEGTYYMKMVHFWVLLGSTLFFFFQDFEVMCYQDEWNSMIWPSLVMILMYPFGIPFVTFVLLYRARTVLDEPKVRFQLGFLYESYTRVAWFWELVVMANKLFLTSFVGFFPDAMQMPAALIVFLSRVCVCVCVCVCMCVRVLCCVCVVFVCVVCCPMYLSMRQEIP